MSRTAIFMTVGLSLYDNIWNRLHTDPLAKSRISGRNMKVPEQKEDLLYDIGAYYDFVYPNLLGELNNQPKLRNVAFPSAEVESLCFWLESVRNRGTLLEKLFLLPTDTEKARKCAEQIRQIISNTVFESRLLRGDGIRIGDAASKISICPFDLNVENMIQFSQDVATFITMLEGKLAKLDEAGIERRIFNITGGYKVLVSIFSLFAFLRNDVEVIYKHEDAGNFINVPSLPLSWDLKLFDEYRALIHEGRQSLSFEPPPKLEALFQIQDVVWVKNAFGRMLEDIYSRDKFKRFGAGARLMQHLDPVFKNELEGYIDHWEYIWIGDQIPETVEHSRGHSTRLLEYASDLLEPHTHISQKLLTDEEIYLLICCLWLHDIGHTALVYDLELENGNTVTIPVGMFPTLSRRWHSLLSYKLIKNGDYLRSSERCAVAMISKYHRGKFPLATFQNPWIDEQFPIVVGPMMNQFGDSLPFRGKDLHKDRILIISALLKVIDGCDMQSDRVINKHYWEMRSERTRTEVDYLVYLLKGKLELLGICNGCIKSKIEELAELLYSCKNRWDEVAESVSETKWYKAEDVENFVDDKIEKFIFPILANVCFRENLDEAEKEIIIELLSMIDRAAFKMRQEAHFYKHSRVKLVYLTNENQQHRFNMVFDKPAKLTICQKRKLAKEIWREYSAVKEILEDRVQFEGVFSEGDKIYPSNGG